MLPQYFHQLKKQNKVSHPPQETPIGDDMWMDFHTSQLPTDLGGHGDLQALLVRMLVHSPIPRAGCSILLLVQECQTTTWDGAKTPRK